MCIRDRYLRGSGAKVVVATVHFHAMTAKNAIKQAATAFKMFWDDLAMNILRDEVRFLTGDFNMAVNWDQILVPLDVSGPGWLHSHRQPRRPAVAGTAARGSGREATCLIIDNPRWRGQQPAVAGIRRSEGTIAAAMGQDWAEVFAENLQKIINDLSAGKTNALSELMHRETQRVLTTTPALMVPGAA